MKEILYFHSAEQHQIKEFKGEKERALWQKQNSQNTTEINVLEASIYSFVANKITSHSIRTKPEQ